MKASALPLWSHFCCVGAVASRNDLVGLPVIDPGQRRAVPACNRHNGLRSFRRNHTNSAPANQVGG